MIDLEPFCDPDQRRLGIGKPRLVDGMVCATNGRMLVRCQPEQAEPFEPAEGRFPNTADVMEGIADVAEWEQVAVADCEVCGNTGFTTGECGRCFGRGDHYCDECGNEGPCNRCDGRGTEQTRCVCNGSHEVAGIVIPAQRMYLVNTLPGVMWQTAAAEFKAFFRFAHGDGAVSGMSRT